MTLHRLHAFVTFPSHDTFWDFPAPRVCLATEIFDDFSPQQWDNGGNEAVKEDRLALSGERCVFAQNHPELAPLLESFIAEIRMKKFTRDEQKMLDARCKVLVEAGALQPRSVAQVELTDQVRLQAEKSSFAAPESGSSLTRQLADVMRGLTAAQFDPSHPGDLTQEQEAVSDSEYLLASTQPWLGMAVNPWGDENEDGSWSQQRLFVDRTGYARLCKLYGGDEELRLEAGFVRVTFARCGEERDVLETELLWPDFTLVDQKIDKETKVASDTCVTRARWKKDGDQVVPPDCRAHRDAGRHTMAAVQETLNAQQVYPTGAVAGTLMWDRKGHQFCVLSEKTGVQWELMEMMVRHTMGGGTHMAPMGSVTGEFQLPFYYYEKDQRWSYQPLKCVQKVDVVSLRARLKLRYDEAAPAPLRLLHQTWPEGQFDPGRKEYQPPVFQGTYQAESDTSSVDTARESTCLDPAQIAELSQKGGQTVFLVRYQYRRGKVILMLGKPNAERGKGLRTCELSNKQMHRYSYSASLGQRGEHLPLGGQSAGCSGGLVGTIRQQSRHGEAEIPATVWGSSFS
ncbi:hypothetical protein CYMTET_16208 [Cymbomonas tetramitiformis]|uniref:Uncharacterized protein n=1 Tax=Cymbomonas tetramitiformis TaxID=36881 RepID=A0AAE0L8K2_9CHLO|nr:hypothetical protein CYMTET_16208 [Cymbomonas tetramitiformis]